MQNLQIGRANDKSQIEGGDVVVANVRQVLEAARLAHVRVRDSA